MSNWLFLFYFASYKSSINRLIDKEKDGTRFKRLRPTHAERCGNGSSRCGSRCIGGTIAFIVGIYDELIDSIKSINGKSLKLFFTGKWGAFWKAINGNFLISLLAGIGISVFSLAKIITWLLTDHPVMVWAFFFGLVLASTWFVGKDIKEWNTKTIPAFIIGVAVAYYITVATPAETPPTYFLYSFVERLPFVL